MKKDRTRKTLGKNGKQTRDMILRAALAVFSRHPYNAASIRMIAARGDFYHGLIRYHFPSKAAIFEAVVENACRDLRQANKMWLEEIAPLDPEHGMSLYLDRFIAYYENNPEVFCILVQNLAQEDSQSIPGYAHLTELLAGTRTDFEEVSTLPLDNDTTTRFLESFNALIIHFLGSSAAESRLLGFEPDSPDYRKWVKDTMMLIFLPVLERVLAK